MSDIETRLEYDRIWLTLEGGGDVDGPLPLYTASSVLRELVHHGVGWARGASRRS